eukprot:gnl/Trimastix_PCT/1830.p1 GENE.gnl/Trimastix_PCT/1830~~gnl/Trimastix_PCT/1830.p1  ORF type:complete len:133 (-),score=38.11 gnl/Trimastix_PCT/1830:41-439(-)
MSDPESQASLAVVQSFIRPYVGQFDASLLHPDFTWWVLGDLPTSGLNSKQKFLNNLRYNKMTFPPHGQRIEVRNIFASGSHVTVEGSTHGVDAMGEVLALDLVFLYEIEGGKIKQIREYMDTKKIHERFHSV